MRSPRVPTALLLAGALPFTGCQTYEEHSLTHKLWSDPSLTDHYEPAGTRAVKSFQRPPSPRLLVSYDERCEKDSSVRRRAFFLPDSAKSLARQRKPGFTNPAPGADWIEVPVIIHGEPAPAAPLYLALAADHKCFTIVRDGVADGPHRLPTYVDQRSTAFRVAMTPVAVAADVTVVALWCGVVAIYVYAGGPVPLGGR
ncbi:MAG: Uncharacterized protein FD161_3361 [Limisphaerales bacterium]|nr:MAG: Uncharacterized protein FD161_3361 [Limisphaerales bacterium]KAG0507786.1 MAG: Uncharacterized protein E1N63_3027 [Limisphaerales bacterium]TXT48789.1 MAG: Uncharacterized protein FD140_3455 [Limisphaerales bacterium]